MASDHLEARLDDYRVDPAPEEAGSQSAVQEVAGARAVLAKVKIPVSKQLGEIRCRLW